MIRVIASIEIKPGQRAAFLQALFANVPHVRAEPGCLDYTPMVDTPSGLPPQLPLNPPRYANLSRLLRAVVNVCIPPIESPAMARFSRPGSAL